MLWRTWEEHVETPVRALAAVLAAGAVLTDVEPSVARAVELLCRRVVPEQWAGWGDATTDGAVVDLGWWETGSTPVVAGRVWVGFSSVVALVRVAFTIDGDRNPVHCRVSVGAVDGERADARVDRGGDGPTGGGVTTYPATVLVLRGDGPDGAVVPHLAVGRRLEPIAWTEVATFGPPPQG